VAGWGCVYLWDVGKGREMCFAVHPDRAAGVPNCRVVTGIVVARKTAAGERFVENVHVHLSLNGGFLHISGG
jgi:hypothetical protein